jgi:hypothetical protein
MTKRNSSSDKLSMVKGKKFETPRHAPNSSEFFKKSVEPKRLKKLQIDPFSQIGNSLRSKENPHQHSQS